MPGRYHLNSGYGQQTASALHNAYANGGKVIMVARSAAAGRQLLQDLFEIDPDGINRYAATIDAANGYATANRGDVILVAPNHTETLTAAITLDTAGVSVIGLGTGTDRPQITGNFVGDNITVTAANVTIANLYFNESTAAATADINVAAAHCKITGCHFDAGDANNLECITVTAAGDNLTVEGNTFVVTGDGPDAAIEIEAAGTNITTIRNNTFICSDGTNAFDAGAINSVVANTNLLVTGNYFMGAGVSSNAVVAASATDKVVVSNFYGGDALEVDSNSAVGQAIVNVTNTPAPEVTDERVWYVDSVDGNVAFSGHSPQEALVTIAAAITAASAGDTIIVAGGHAETLTASITVGTASLTIIGSGQGARRPSLTGNVAADTVTITAANVVFENFQFNEATLVTGGAINIAGADCVIRGCVFDLGTNDLEAITVADAGDRAVIEGNTFNVTADGPDAAIEVEAAGVDRLVARNNLFVCSDGTNAFDAAAINSGAANTNMIIAGNTFVGRGVASTAVIAATAIDKTISGNTYGGEAIPVDNDEVVPVPVEGVNPFGNIWYVAASGGNNSFSGRHPRAAFATIAAAVTAGAAGDTIILGPGTHTVDVGAATITPLANMTFKGAIPSYGGKPSTVVTADADDNAARLFTMDVNGVRFEDIEFLLVAGGTTHVSLVTASQTTAVNGLVFKDCWFNLNAVDAAVTAIDLDDATNDTTGLVIKGCRFTGGSATTGAATYIDIGVQGIDEGLIEGCKFGCESTDDDCVAIAFADPTTTGVGYGFVIKDNDFMGPTDGAVTLVPIATAGGASGEWVGCLRTNYFSHTSVNPVPINQMDESLIRNYVGDLTTGGTIVDAGA